MASKADFYNSVAIALDWPELTGDQHVAIFGGTAEGYSAEATEEWWSGLDLPNKPDWATAGLVSRRDSAKADPKHPLAAYSAAWEWVGDTARPRVDLAKARGVHRDVIRRQRSTAWPAADAAWFKAMDAGDREAIEAAAATRQALRDAPTHASIDAASSLAELKAITLQTILAKEG